MGKTERPGETGMENLSVNSSRRTGIGEGGAGNSPQADDQRDSTSSARVPDQQIPPERTSPPKETTAQPDAGAADLPKTG